MLLGPAVRSPGHAKDGSPDRRAVVGHLELGQIKLARVVHRALIWPLARALVSAGTAKAAKMAIIAITTSSSMSVKALMRSRCWKECAEEVLFIFIGFC